MSIYHYTILPDLFGNSKKIQKLDTETFIIKAQSIHKERYSYELTVYKNIMTKIKIICPEHGIFIKNPRDHLHGSGCPECQRLKRTLTPEQYILLCKDVHKDKYQYTNTKFISARHKVTITCPKHGSFKINPYSHLNGIGCKLCKLQSKYNQDQKTFIEKAVYKYGNRYDYSNVVFNGINEHIKVKCNLHGEFLISPYGHLKGSGGCKYCYGNHTKTSSNFIKDATNVHGTKYDYSASIYVNAHTKIIIACKIHGTFRQTPNNHLNGSGCTKCTKNISKMETKWLDSLNIPIEYRQKTLQTKSGKYYKVDAYDPTTNIVYEFFGDFWHGNPQVYLGEHINHINKKTFQQLYHDTMNKINDLKSQGYELITIWESDWKRYVVERVDKV